MSGAKLARSFPYLVAQKYALNSASFALFFGKSGTKFFDFLMEIIRITIVQARMCIENLLRVLDRAEILLGACGDFLRVGQQPDGVRTIHAVRFFNDVQVGQVLMIQHDIVGVFFTFGLFRIVVQTGKQLADPGQLGQPCRDPSIDAALRILAVGANASRFFKPGGLAFLFYYSCGNWYFSGSKLMISLCTIMLCSS